MRLCKFFAVILGFYIVVATPSRAQVNPRSRSFPHLEQMQQNFQKPDSNFYPKKAPKSSWLKKIPAPRLEYEVFGWYPHWDHKYYQSMNYKLLTTVAFFNKKVNPNNGNFEGGKGAYDWPKHPVIKMTRDNGKRILLTATCFGYSSLHTLLSSATSTNKLITNLVNANSEGNGNGICIDFEGMSSDDKANFSNFMSALKTALLQQNAGNKLYLAVPAVDLAYPYDFNALVKSVDRFVIMGYDYYYNGSTMPGPNSPLESGEIWYNQNLTTSVKYYLGEDVPNNQLILALPFYGHSWDAISSDIPTTKRGKGSTFSYSYIASKGYAPLLEDYSKSTYHMLPNGSNYTQYWYEADQSFQDKLALVTGNQLAGMGIWALGYESPYTDLWVTIMKALTNDGKYLNLLKFIPRDSVLIDSVLHSFHHQNDTTIINPPDSTHTNPSDTTSFNKIIKILEKNFEPVIDYRCVLLITLSFFAVFGALGILLGIFFPDTRNYFFGTSSIRNIWIYFVMLTLLVILFMADIITLGGVPFVVGFVLGAYVFYQINKFIENRRKNLP